MILTSYSATPVGFSASDMRTTPLQIMAASIDGPMDILRPGARYSVPLVFQSPGQAGPLDIRVGRILADDTRLIEDWGTIEASIRPAGIADEAWTVFWGRIKPLIGATWGEYVQVLDLMMTQVSEPGRPVRDVREIFARMYQQNPDFVPYSSLSGQVRDAESDTGLPAVQMAAYLVKGDGSLQYKASALSDDDGSFTFGRLTPGAYKVMAVGRALDMDRNGQIDQTLPQVTLGHTQPGDAGVIYIQPLGGIGSHNDSSAALERDANGVTHMVWSRDGEIWHAWFDAGSGQWRDAQALSTGDSYGPAIASSSKLFDGADAGIIVAWQQGKGNDAEIWYAVARARSGDGFEWSAPVQLTDDATMDVGAQIIVGDNGLVMITHLKSDGDIQDDTDVYYDIFALSASDFVWPQAVQASADVALDTEGVSVAYGRQWKFGPWDFFGTEAEIALALSGSVGENNCVATLGAQGQISGSFKGSSIRSTISGNGNVSAEWTVNQASKDWLFNGAKAGWGASAQFDWRYGLSTLLSKIPHPAVTSAYLAYSLGVGLARRFGLEFEDGITFGGGASFTGMSWSFTQPFPDFVWPESIAEASLSGTLGVYAQLDVTGGDSARLQGDITVTVDIAPAVRLKSITGNITFSGNIGWFTFNEVFSIDFYSAGALEAEGAPLQTQDASGPQYDPAALLGTGNAYGANHVLADVSDDLLADSALSLANDDGTLFGAWTHMDDPTLAIGSSVMVAEFNGSTWDAPVALGGSAGINTFAAAAVDGLGRRMVVWSHADSSALGTAPTLEDYEAALDAGDVVYALYDESSGSWGTMTTVASTAGMDSALAIGRDGQGNLVLSWLARAADGSSHLMSSIWDGSAWDPALEIAAGTSVMDPALAQLGEGVIVVWTEDANPDPDASEKALHYSVFDGAAWSAGALFDPIAMATGLALSAGTPVPSVADTSLSTEGLFPPFPVPEECLKCKP
ncbi:MAG: carboxypeptidase regulatory-like domain-containing protein, partial [Chloroflexi bacterium]|nr:carboxypeptidase regulatory-like domain-containing protein [Chloroflexota bacterium]